MEIDTRATLMERAFPVRFLLEKKEKAGKNMEFLLQYICKSITIDENRDINIATTH